MAGAGFYPISSARITFGRDGRWYSDGEPIVNRRIADLFSRSVHRHPQGGYEIVVGEERARIEVEDTPYVVISVGGSPESGFTVVLNDGSAEPLDVASIRAGADNVPSCAVKGGEERARFLRAAYYQLTPFIEEEHGHFYLHCRDSRHPIARS